MTALSIQNLTKKYGKYVAVENVSFNISPGEIFGLLGPNGSGKTTIISCITTLQPFCCGSIKIFDNNITTHPKAAKKHVGCVPQELIHHGFFTVESILKYHAMYFGIPFDKEYTKHLMNTLDLYHHRKKLVRELSGGMKRRLLIVKALLHKPQLLLLDEPTAGVDIELRSSLWTFIKKLKAENLSILLTTHYLEEAESLCDRIGIIDHGRLKQVGTTNDLLQKYSLKHIILTLSRPIKPINHPLITQQDDTAIHLKVPNTMPFSEIIQNTHIPHDVIADINIQMGRLEDVMYKILNGDTHE